MRLFCECCFVHACIPLVSHYYILLITHQKEKKKPHANKHKKKVVLQPGDLIWIHLRKERFPSRRKSKLMPRAYGPFEVLWRLNDNAHKVDLPRDYGALVTMLLI